MSDVIHWKFACLYVNHKNQVIKVQINHAIRPQNTHLNMTWHRGKFPLSSFPTQAKEPVTQGMLVIGLVEVPDTTQYALQKRLSTRQLMLQPRMPKRPPRYGQPNVL